MTASGGANFLTIAATAARLPTRAAVIAGMLLAAGCAGTPQSDALLSEPTAVAGTVELTDVPFFAQTEHQCGPAALATTLAWAGAAVTPDDLEPLVYLPRRRGSLQLELLSAARRHGFVAYVLAPRLEHVLEEVANGTPVLVLQNLGLEWYPKWHYAVVVGFDSISGAIILRSGTERRHVVPLRVFERTWERAGHWAMVSMPPGRLPHTAEEFEYVEAIVGLERGGHWHEVATAYDAALSRWPDNLVARIGLGNSRYALGELPGAEAAYRRAVRDHPDSAVAFNNLAQVLADQGRLREAEKNARQAIDLGGPMHAELENTLLRILARSRAASDE